MFDTHVRSLVLPQNPRAGARRKHRGKGPEEVMPDIGSSVGVKDGIPCYNNPGDQKVVMDLLEQIDVADGGLSGDARWRRPAAGTLRWKFCPEPLSIAILNFQKVNRAKLPYQPDGHVDPGGATIRLMNSLA